MLIRCEPCNKTYSSKQILTIHLKSKLHQKNTEDPNTRPKLKSTDSDELFTLNEIIKESWQAKQS